ncbi:3'-5' exonuclease, partial [Pseudomonadota bacterium]
ARLRELLSRERPPLDFLVDENQLSGPVLGTIHASKGREANQVHLMLPPDNFMDDNPDSPYVMTPAEIAEEERVLFVGATRAKQRLMVGKGNKMYASRYDGRRTFRGVRGNPNARMVEVGLNGDIDLVSMADERLPIDHAGLQQWLWEQADTVVDLKIRYDAGLNVNVLEVVHDGAPVALMSKRFTWDLWGIGKIVAKKNGIAKCKPGSVIRHVRMTGVRTVVVPEAERERLLTPWRHSGFLLAPIISGFSMVYFNPCGGS